MTHSSDVACEEALSPRAALGRGVIAGVVGTAAMTAWQELSSRLKDDSDSSDDSDGTEQDDPWQSAPAPAQVAKRLIEGVFQREVGPEKIPLLTNVMHWAYGTGWGAVYAIGIGGRGNPLPRGLLFGSGVWAMSYVQLVPMGLYEPPWKYPVKTLAQDLSYHLVYGIGVALAAQYLDRHAGAARRYACRP